MCSAISEVQHLGSGGTDEFLYRTEDFRFTTGGPIDALYFEGLFENRSEVNVILGDRKTGWSNANSRQKKIAEAVDAHCHGDKERVRFESFGDRQPRNSNREY